jgi:hypothetical protein
VRRVSQRRRSGSEENRREQSVNEAAAGFPAGSVCHINLWIAEADFTNGGGQHDTPVN